MLQRQVVEHKKGMWLIRAYWFKNPTTNTIQDFPQVRSKNQVNELREQPGRKSLPIFSTFWTCETRAKQINKKLEAI